MKPAAVSAEPSWSEQTIRFSRESDAFYGAVRARVDAYFNDLGATRHATPWMWAKVATLFAAWIATYVALLLVRVGPGVSLGFALFFGVLTVLLVLNVGHDAAHETLSPDQRVNRILAELSLSLPGANAYLYKLVHNTPHPFPNVAGIDVTLEQVGSLIRLSPQAPLRRYHRWQHLYSPILYSLYSLFLVFVKDFKIFARTRIGNHFVSAHPRIEIARFGAFKLLYVAYALALPLWILPYPWHQVLLGFLATHLLMGALIAVVLQPVHLSADRHFSTPDPSGHIDRNWAIYQMEATKDYAPNSALGNLLVGGLNTHAIHHLFPSVCHIHYRPLTRILRDACTEFGVPYTSTTFPGAVADHFRFLSLMGRLPEDATPAPGKATLLETPRDRPVERVRYFSHLNYGLGEEDTSVEHDLLPLDAGHVLAVAGSGSRIVPLLARKPRRLTCVDINPLQLALTRLRLTALRHMEHDEYTGFLGYPPAPWNAERRRRAFQALPIDAETRAALEPMLTRHQWQPIVYAGRFEQMLKTLARFNRATVGRRGAEIFDCRSVAEQRDYYAQRFPRWRWRVLLSLLANSTVLNALLYRGEFPKKNLPESTFAIYERIFHRLLTEAPARESFFLQLAFFGEIRYEEGCPIECDRATWSAARECLDDVRITTAVGDLLDAPNVGPDGFVDFVSASDVPSFLPPQTADSFLQRLRPRLAPGALVVSRGHLRVVTPVIDGFSDLSGAHAIRLAAERTQLWTIRVHQRLS
jgi:S-adenosylmethionine-diacylglycerol 3-amino-3-carboxypropyl transferase